MKDRWYSTISSLLETHMNTNAQRQTHKRTLGEGTKVTHLQHRHQHSSFKSRESISAGDGGQVGGGEASVNKCLQKAEQAHQPHDSTLAVSALHYHRMNENTNQVRFAKACRLHTMCTETQEVAEVYTELDSDGEVNSRER